jgi:hypothetical protein
MKKDIWVFCVLLNLITDICAQEEKKDSIAQPSSELIAKPIVSTYQQPTITNGYDRIIKLNRDTLVVSIQKITQTEIVFTYPLNTVINRIPVYHVKEVYSKDGIPNVQFKSLSGPVKKAKNDSIPVANYKSIIVTFNEADVEGMTELGPIDSHSEGEKITTSATLMEKNAISVLRKKAAQMGATKVLITDKNTQSAYGEAPIVEMKGIAYK